MYWRVHSVFIKEVYFPEVDRNGINIEFTVKKHKAKDEDLRPRRVLNLCHETIETFTQAMRKQLLVLTVLRFCRRVSHRRS